MSRVKYLTTLEVAPKLQVSKQTRLNWLYDGKVPEPPRNRKGYRLWSPSRVSLVRKLIADGRLHTRTGIHRQPSNRPDLVAEYAREVHQFLVEGGVDVEAFLRELGPLNPAVSRRLVVRQALAADARGVHQCLVEGGFDVEAFLRELGRLNPAVSRRLVVRKALPGAARGARSA